MSDTGSFIVVFKDHVTKEQVDQFANEVSSGGGSVGERYNPMFVNGFQASLKPGQLQSFKANDAIAYIEPDQIVTTQ